MFKIIGSLDVKKSCMKDDLPTKLLIATNDIITPKLTKIFNEAKRIEKFPSSLKTADVTPLPKDREKDNKKKYRPVSLTPIISKVFEKEMYGQIYSFADCFLSPYVFGYRTGRNSEQCMLVMIETWKKLLMSIK